MMLLALPGFTAHAADAGENALFHSRGAEADRVIRPETNP
jgi:hypothetical protein